MSAEMVGILALVVMLVLMMLRVPIVISMMLPAVIGIFYLRDWTVLATSVESNIWTHSFSYSLSVIPMFLWMGEMLTFTGISSELYSTFQKWLGRFKGGLSMATIGASAVFAAASGSSIANTATIGQMAAKEMMNNKYDNSLAGGSIVAGGTLGILIPPSSFLIVYGMLTEESIGNLLLAAIIPGVLLALLFILTIYIAVLSKSELAPKGEKVSWKERIISLKSTMWILVLFIIVIGGMFIGLFGPTEAAGIGAMCSTIIAAAKRKLTWSIFTETILRTVRNSGFIYAILLSGFLFSYLLAISKVPIAASSFLLGLDISPLAMFTLIVIMYILLGMVMDSLAAVVITVPFVIPIMSSLGHDLVWFGIVLCILVEMALISPPYGMNIMVLNGTVPELKIGKIYKGATLFLLPMLVIIVLLYMFPEIALWLPSQMIG
ncbi:TRAP transporter large permease [Neobacillus drentensis]|uniref:TRAP transporter large permease n=1 Tax=Neobacillus drentensis TaxID=220684 RepID=UPI002FFE66C5